MCAVAKPIFKNVFPNQYVVKVKIAIIILYHGFMFPHMSYYNSFHQAFVKDPEVVSQSPVLE